MTQPRSARFVVRLAFCALFAFFASAALGCGEHIAGTHDVVLLYHIDSIDGADASDPSLAVALVKRRLGSAHIAADVHLADERATDAPPGADAKRMVAIVVDDSQVPSIETLLAWRGGVTILRADPAAGDPLYKGPASEAASRASLAMAKVDASHLAVLELTDDATASVRVVEKTPALDATNAIARVTTLHGNVIDLEPTDAIKAQLAPLLPELAKGTLLVARGRSILPIVPASSALASSADHLYVTFPATLPGYARAHASAQVLQSPVLPRLTRSSETRAPVDYALATGCLAVPFVLSALWLLFVRRFDRAEPEPLWLVGATFLLGCLSCVPAGLAEYGFARATPWLNPTYATMGGQLIAVPFALLVFSLVVGVSEEGSKFLGAWTLARHRREFDEPVDGIIYAAASALGFAAVENVKYFALGRLTAALIVARTFMSIPAHLLFASIWGYGMGKRVVFKRARVLPWFVLAAVLHGAFDTFLSFGSLGVLSVVLEGSIALVFIVLLRSALRYGPVDPNVGEIPDSERVVIPVGSPGRFAASAIAFVTSMIPLAILAGMLEGRHPRSVIPLLLLGSVLVLLSGLAAYAVSATMPLDVVADTHGITFAGARRSWSTVRELNALPHRRKYAQLVAADGDLYIGPADASTLARIDTLVRHYARGR